MSEIGIFCGPGVCYLYIPTHFLFKVIWKLFNRQRKKGKKKKKGGKGEGKRLNGERWEKVLFCWMHAGKDFHEFGK